MEIYFKFAVCTFLILNIAFLLNLFLKTSKEVEPSLIGSSVNIEEKSESKFYKTIKDSLLKYFKPHESDSLNNLLKIHPEVMTHENILKFSKDSKISMFLESFKREDIYVVKLNHDNEILPNGKEIPSGQISLYSINAESLTSKNKNVGESNIRKCWTTIINGRIIGVVSSDNKQSLAVYYRKPKGKKSDYRIRYIHKLHCESIEIEQSDSENKEKILDGNYYNDTSYDDFIIHGNLPVSYIAIQNEAFVFSRDKDVYQFQIFKRVKESKESKTKINWKLALLGPKIDKDDFPYFHTNSLKFVPDNTNEFRLLHVFIAISSKKGVVLNGEMFASSSSENLDSDQEEGQEEHEHNFNSESELSTTITKFFEHILDDEVIGNAMSFEESMTKLKKYMKPTIFSNISNDSLFFEIHNSNVLISMDWDDKSVQFQYLFEVKSKISRIFGENSGRNVIIKFENDNDLVLIKRERNENQQPGENFYINAKPYSVSLNKLPEKIKNKDFVSFSLENINEKVVLFAVNEDGFFFALELTESKVKQPLTKLETMMYRVKEAILPDETASVYEILIRYLITNIIPLILYLKYYFSLMKKEETEYIKNEKNSRRKVKSLLNKSNKLETKIYQEKLETFVIS